MLLQNVIASQLSKNFSACFAAQFLFGSAKVAVIFIPPNFSLDFFSAEPFFRTKIYCAFFEELSAFFEAGCKYSKLIELLPNNYLKDIHI
jgi:hypothetical protein